MASFPAYARLLLPDASDSFDPSVRRTQMDRGVPKMRRKNSRVLAAIAAVVFFRAAADAEAFEDWYFDTIHRIDFFDLKHPRTGQVVSARIREIGELIPLAGAFAVSRRSLTLEYLR